METESLDVASGREAGAGSPACPAARRPTAAFCGNDLPALGLLQHAIGTGVKVPEDWRSSATTTSSSRRPPPSLTSVRQPRRELGRTAAELVLDESGNPEHEHRQVLFTPELVARESTRRGS